MVRIESLLEKPNEGQSNGQTTKEKAGLGGSPPDAGKALSGSSSAGTRCDLGMVFQKKRPRLMETNQPFQVSKFLQPHIAFGSKGDAISTRKTYGALFKVTAKFGEFGGFDYRTG